MRLPRSNLIPSRHLDFASSHPSCHVALSRVRRLQRPSRCSGSSHGETVINTPGVMLLDFDKSKREEGFGVMYFAFLLKERERLNRFHWGHTWGISFSFTVIYVIFLLITSTQGIFSTFIIPCFSAAKLFTKRVEIMDRSRVIMRDHKNSMKHAKPMTVFIWDMDETMILLKSLLDGTYAEAFNGLKDKRKGIEIGKQWENHILQVCDKYFFYEEIEDYNEPFIDALTEYDDGRDLSKYDFDNDGFGFPYDDCNKRKLAYRHRSISDKYSQGLHKILDQHTVKIWNDLYSLTDSYTNGWLSSAHALLKQTLDTSSFPESYFSSDVEPGSVTTKNINAVVTSGSLIPSLAKCMLYRLDDVISANNVYSSWEVGKLRCFSWINERFAGPNVRFCVIGDGTEECEAAHAMGWPFIKIDLRSTSSYRFPGLTMKIIQSHIDVTYGSSDAEAEGMKSNRLY